MSSKARVNLIASVNFNINRMPEQGPSVSGIPFYIGAGIEKIPQEWNGPKLDRIMSRPARHGTTPHFGARKPQAVARLPCPAAFHWPITDTGYRRCRTPPPAQLTGRQ